tara:strand:+ start:1668 stop:2588 length:921 start_codon:yes stop_codon:yes gene_type:complete
MKIGIIGDGGHSKRIQKILKKKRRKFYVYKPDKPKYFDEQKYKQLKKCEVIFIISPNSTHYSYINKLYKGRYIFCEKPPVNTKKELAKLKKIRSKKIYFNYNFRFSKITELLANRKKYNLGKLIYANLSLSHGLAQKKVYKNNWRSNIKICPKGVYEIVSVHYIDLICHLFEISKIEKPKLINLSKIGNGYDTSLVEIRIKNEGLVNIFSTYNSSYNKSLSFFFENGIIEQHNNIIKVKGPTLNLDNQGFFKPPKVKKNIKIDETKDYSNSLLKSVEYFLFHVMNKKKFSDKITDTSFKSNSLITK